MEYWKVLSETLKQRGFSTAQIKKLKVQFGSLDAEALLNTTHDKLLLSMTGRSVPLKQKKVKTFLAAVKEVDTQLGNSRPPLGRRQSPGLLPITLYLVELGDPKKPLKNYRVRITQKSNDGKEKNLESYSNAEGIIHTEIPVEKDPDGSIPENIAVLLRVFGIDDTELLKKKISVIVRKPEPVTLKVDTAKYLAKLKGPIESLGTSLSPRLITILSQKKIKNLVDLRDLKTINKLGGLSTTDRTQVEVLFAHARLQVLSRDTKINQTLIEKNYRSLADITSAPYTRFLKDVKNKIGEDKAKTLHKTARKQQLLLTNIETERRVYEANGFSGKPQFSTATAKAATHVDCGCKDCHSAVSPAAYLADLMDYTVDHVQHNNTTLTTSALQSRFKQPFLDLISDCKALGAPVRQVRLVIELLRVLAFEQGLDIDSILEGYTSTAYNAVLRELGITRQSLRDARYRRTEKERIEATIGIAKEKVPALLLSRENRTETRLEQLFGLQETGRDPLSSGAKRGDEKNQITRWQLVGASWNKNTDDNGQITGRLKKSGGKYICELFKSDDLSSEKRIALGETREKTGTIDLLPENSSGLTGKIRIDWKQDDTFTIAAVPELLAWRLQFLRALWKQEDYSVKTPLPMPMVDPDLLVEDDFMQPYKKNPAHKLFTHRQSWINKLEQELDRMPSLADQIKRFTQVVEYPLLSNRRDIHKKTLWTHFNATDINKWTSVLADLQSGDESKIELAMQRLRDDVHLDAASFQYLAVAQNELKVLTGDARKQFADEAKKTAIPILLKAIKERFYELWIGEEENLGISLSAPFFSLSSLEPALPPHRADPALRAQWKEQLRLNYEAPILDPDRFTDEWFTATDEADTAFRINKGRSKSLLERSHKLKTKMNTGKRLAKMLTGVSGELGIHGFGFGKTLEPQRKRLKEGKPFDIQPAQYGLTAAALTILLNVLELAKNNDTDDEDWEQVYHILIGAEKVRHLFPAWRKEEQEKEITITPDAFRFPDSLENRIDPQPGATRAFRDWRVDTAPWRDFRKRLEERINRQNAVIEAQANLVDQLEEAVLPELRNALLEKVVNESDLAPGEDKATWFTNHFLINAAAGACQKTTRVAQAMETLQLLVWGLYTKQFEDSSYTIEPGDAFEEEWKWMGTYGSWRAALFVFLYPENILRPDFVDEKYRIIEFKAFYILLNDWPEILNSSQEGHDTSEAENNQLPDDDVHVQHIVRQVNSWYFGQAHHPPTYNINDYLSRTWLKDLLRGIWGFSDISSLQDKFQDAYYIPFAVALRLQQKGNFSEALYWYAQIYETEQLKLTYNVRWVIEQLSQATTFLRQSDWAQDPLDLHQLALSRTGVFERTIVIAITQCLLDYAESEFASDTAESLARARELYLSAQRLLNAKALKQTYRSCDDVIGELTIQIGDPVVREIVIEIMHDLFLLNLNVNDIHLEENIEGLSHQIEAKLPEWKDKDRKEIRMEANKLISKHFPVQATSSLDEKRALGIKQSQVQFTKLLEHPAVFETVQKIEAGTIIRNNHLTHRINSGNEVIHSLVTPDLISIVTDNPLVTYIPAPNATFCIPPNPVLIGLRLRAVIGLFKLNNCMNVAGTKREVPAFSAPTDTRTGIPVVNSGGSLVLPFGAPVPPPTQYRYKVLLERTRQLLGISQQMESSFLNFLERRDQETYSLLTAEQQLEVARAGVILQNLRLDEAELQKGIADLQAIRVDSLKIHYSGLIEKGLLADEKSALDILGFVAFLELGVTLISVFAGGALFGAPTGGAAAGFGALAGAIATGGKGLSTLSSVKSMRANWERRNQEWQLQKDLATKDLVISKEQVKIAEKHINIVKQERTISRISAENSDDVVRFLQNKFTNAELYEWMSGVVSDLYRYFLQQATAMARLAQSQLAFERQERGLIFIQSDYWQVDSGGLTASFSGEENQNRRGLTGSARLLRDLTQLDQHAFLTDQRKLQMSKTISLASLDPIPFQQFRETGVLPFSTPLDLFDRDFPGHYLRLIKRVRTTVVALIPPVDGIKATLSMGSISRVVTEQLEGFAETVMVRAERQEVALTAPMNASGVFELVEQADMLLPFEGSGVAADWIFELPKASNSIEYSSIADVLITIEYTALNSQAYRQQVIQEMDRTFSADRPYSFRHQFADAWYDLHNSDQMQGPRQPMRVSFTTRQEDFPPNITDLKIEQVTLFIARKSAVTEEFNLDLNFAAQGGAGSIGGSATTVKGIVSTRQNNAGSLTSMKGKSPVGEWTLVLEDKPKIHKLFEDGLVKDILFVITIGGITEEWPG